MARGDHSSPLPLARSGGDLPLGVAPERGAVGDRRRREQDSIPSACQGGHRGVEPKAGGGGRRRRRPLSHAVPLGASTQPPTFSRLGDVPLVVGLLAEKPRASRGKRVGQVPVGPPGVPGNDVRCHRGRDRGWRVLPCTGPCRDIQHPPGPAGSGGLPRRPGARDGPSCFQRARQRGRGQRRHPQDRRHSRAGCLSAGKRAGVPSDVQFVRGRYSGLSGAQPGHGQGTPRTCSYVVAWHYSRLSETRA